MLKLKIAAAAALGLISLSPLPAAAAQARASGDAPVRECPRSSCDVIDNLEDGEYYEVFDCTRRQVFCLVGDEDGEELGWVRGSYLIGSGAKARVTPFEFLVDPFNFNN
jgi:hypothetical protein